MRTVAVFLLLFSISCGQEREPASQTVAVVPAPAPAAVQQPLAETRPIVEASPPARKPDPQIEKFKQRMLAFVDEAQTLADLLEIIPDPVEFRAKLQSVRHAYIRVPEPPSRLAPLRQFAKLLMDSLELAGSQLSTMEQLTRLGAPTDEMIRDWKLSNRQTKYYLAALEAKLTGRPVPAEDPELEKLKEKIAKEGRANAEREKQQAEGAARYRAEQAAAERAAREKSNRVAFLEAATKAAAKKEAAAANKLKLIKELLDAGKTDAAKARLKKFDEDYAGTEAAAAAKELLEKLEK
jgi:hypothetical protein